MAGSWAQSLMQPECGPPGTQGPLLSSQGCGPDSSLSILATWSSTSREALSSGGGLMKSSPARCTPFLEVRSEIPTDMGPAHIPGELMISACTPGAESWGHLRICLPHPPLPHAASSSPQALGRDHSPRRSCPSSQPLRHDQQGWVSAHL